MEIIKNIVFDLGGVIVGLNGERSIKAFNDIGAQNVARYIEEHRTEDLFYKIELGLSSTDDFCNEARQIAGIDNVDAEIIDAWNKLLEAPTEQCLRRLLELKAAGYRMFILSNTNDMHWQFFINNLLPDEIAKCFDHFFLSYEMHLSKPDRMIFESVLRSAGLNAAETLFIDDNADNITSAHNTGMNTFHNRELNEWITALQL